MSVTVTMPEVTACAAKSCSYNVRGACHARAITISDDSHPQCDTFLPAAEHVHRLPIAGVGACKVSACVHNHDRACAASSIRVSLHEGHPDCATFEHV